MKLVRYIPLGLVFLIMLVVWIRIFTIPVQPERGHYIAVYISIVSIVLYFVNIRAGLYATGVLILLGVFNIAQIFLGKYNIRFFTTGTSDTAYRSLKFDLRCIGLFAIYLACTWGQLFKPSKK